MEVFLQTSDEPYNRHNYEIVLKTGKTVFFDDWDGVQEYWFVHNQIPDFLDVVKVLDKPKNSKNKKGKKMGF